MSLDDETMNKIFNILKNEETAKPRAAKKKRELTEEARQRMRDNLKNARIKALEKQGYKVVKDEETIEIEPIKETVTIANEPDTVIEKQPEPVKEAVIISQPKKEYKKDFKPIEFNEVIIETQPEPIVINPFKKYMLDSYFKKYNL